MKIYLMTLMLLVLLSGFVYAAPIDNEEISRQLFDQLSVGQVNQFVSKINRELNETIPQLNSGTVREIGTKGIHFNWDTIKRMLWERLFRDLATNIHLMGKLLFLVVLCTLLRNLQNSFEDSNIALLTYSVCFIFLMVIALTAFYNILTIARNTVGMMVGFMEALLPLLLSLLAGVGAITSAALFTPLMLFVVNTVSVVVRDAILPLIFLTAVLECVNYLSDQYRLTNLTTLFKQASMVILGLTLVAFIGVITVQGAAGSVTDGVTLRTAKYATTTFIPVVGKMFSDTVELVMGASLFLKNVVGIFGVMVIAIVCLLPLIKLIALILVIKVSGALVQPMGDEKMAKCLDGIGNNLFLAFGAVLTAALMFFLSITMIVGVGSVTMMLK
ncbi:stage iii sporulation protein ae (spore iii ae) [Lucifera butyrica]|uniref:Stage iii sporulation protein ae (Spore iii ae) n=1 Tax=Lucifera butyrica TaxID=1351585 RepID=A0A498RFZ5_9FIRM|nr:stage III sporulation protein AE [Lucifera butyrica]VBB08018.1 stage iii sporulation protein ae (spore iii ae) [Lucifera butyrica]